jgi:hypothetical protein
MTAEQQGHTPGPWEFDPPQDTFDDFSIIGSGTFVASEIENIADARLIAAAPDYDAAAQMLLTGLPDETFQYREQLTKSEVEHLNAAILMFKAARAKATGVQS